MDLHAAVTEKSKNKQEELEKQSRLEEHKDNKDYRGTFYYANFVCRKSGTVIPKLGGEGAIQSHKAVHGVLKPMKKERA